MMKKITSWINLGKMFLLFIALTIFFYGFFVWIEERVENNQRFDSPKGRAVKVHYPYEEATLSSLHDVRNRLLFFYRYGE